jgi:hypothetical protein
MWRDVSIASLMESEVLSKRRKTLMLFGAAHLFHGGSMAVGLYEKDYPGVTLAIATHSGFGNWMPVASTTLQISQNVAVLDSVSR